MKCTIVFQTEKIVVCKEAILLSAPVCTGTICGCSRVAGHDPQSAVFICAHNLVGQIELMHHPNLHNYDSDTKPAKSCHHELHIFTGQTPVSI